MQEVPVPPLGLVDVNLALVELAQHVELLLLVHRGSSAARRPAGRARRRTTHPGGRRTGVTRGRVVATADLRLGKEKRKRLVFCPKTFQKTLDQTEKLSVVYPFLSTYTYSFFPSTA